MSDTGLSGRTLSNLCTSEIHAGKYMPAIEYGMRAVDMATKRADSHFEGIARVTLGQALRLARCGKAAAVQLSRAASIGESLGYAHLLGAALTQLALLELDEPGGQPILALLDGAVERLKRAAAIADANGLQRAACDALHNWHAACLRYGYRGCEGRRDALVGLGRACAIAKEVGYTVGHVRVLLSRGLGRMRSGRLLWEVEHGAELDAAEEDIHTATLLLSRNADGVGGGAWAFQRVQASCRLCLCHMLRATTPIFPSEAAGSAAASREAAALALRHAHDALATESDLLDGRPSPATLANLGIAMLVAGRPATDSLPDAKEAASMAVTHLEAASSAMEQDVDVEQQRRILLALSVAQEQLGATERACIVMRKLMGVSATALCTHSTIGSHAKVAEVAMSEGNYSAALVAYKTAAKLAFGTHTSDTSDTVLT